MNRKLQLPLVAALALVTQADDCSLVLEPPMIKGCPMTYSTDPAFRRAGQYTTFSTDVATKCPLSLDHPGTAVDFNTNGEFVYSGQTGQIDGSTYFFEQMDAYRAVLTQASTSHWHFSAGTYKLTASGTYLAAMAGLYPPGVVNADYLRSYLHRIGDTQNVWAELKAYYSQGERITIFGKFEVIGWEGFDLNAELHDPTLVPPISYSWKKNGVEMGIYTESFYYPGSAPDSNDDFEVTATDLNNTTVTATHHVRTKNCTTPGCMDQ